MGHVQDNAEESVRRLLARLTDGHFRVGMDNGAAIEVAITIDAAARGESRLLRHEPAAALELQRARAGHARRRALYLPRHGRRADPLNAGCLKPIEIVIPDGSLLSPPPAAVVAGNVEISQVVTKPFCRARCAKLHARHHEQPHLRQRALQYYETLCSARPPAPASGAAAVHVHMTNTRLTDPEILELRYPVLLETIRSGAARAARAGGTAATARSALFVSWSAPAARSFPDIERCAVRARRGRAGRGG